MYTQKGYTAAVGVSTNKLLSKLVGNLHKPNNQTTLLPPYTLEDYKFDKFDNVTPFMDGHEVGKITGIGFKLAQKLRAYVVQRRPESDEESVHGGSKEHVLVAEVRKCPGMNPETLERILVGPGKQASSRNASTYGHKFI
jgi:DNA polymerase iota